MQKAMVTGAAGFIGSYLTRLLVEAGIEVVAVDDFTNSYDPGEKLARANRLSALGGVAFHKLDLGNGAITPLLDGVDTVFHLAGRAGVRASFDQYPAYVYDNITATRALIGALHAISRPTRLVYASSSSVYGDAQTPFRETFQPSPISPYGQTKLEAERLVLEANGSLISSVALRYFTVYGPGQRPDMGIRKFIAAALSDREINIFGDGTQSRDFTFVSDIANATMLAGDREVNGIAINIGGGSTVTLLEVMELLAELNRRPLKLRFGDFAKGDVMHTGADLSRARNYLGFTPKVDFAQGLKAQYRWLSEGQAGVAQEVKVG